MYEFDLFIFFFAFYFYLHIMRCLRLGRMRAVCEPEVHMLTDF